MEIIISMKMLTMKRNGFPMHLISCGTAIKSVSYTHIGLLRVDKKLSMTGQDVGFVGDIKKVNAEVLLDLLDKDFLPIVCPVGIDDDYNTYNTVSYTHLS